MSQRTITSVLAGTLVLVTILNIALLTQIFRLRHQVAATVAQQSAVAPSGDVAELQQRLATAEQDRVKAIREAQALKAQADQNKDLTQSQSSMQQQLTDLQNENKQLREQVQNLQTMNTINSRVNDLRGMTAKTAVQRLFMNVDQLRAHFTEVLDREFTPADERRQQAVLAAMNMGGGPNMRQREIDALTNSVLGFYDPETKDLVVVTNRANMGVSDQVTYAHEYMHSLQDQYYDIAGLYANAGDNSDSQMAVRALIEGDATLTEALYAQKNLNEMDIASYQLEQIERIDLSSLNYGPSGPWTESAAMFPYRNGMAFVNSLYAAGGWNAVRDAFANPPRSTEQVLHPEKYAAGEEPVAVKLPDLAQTLRGWSLVHENTLGELNTRIYLEHVLPIAYAVPAGEGWGGDRYQVLQDSQGRLALALQTVWDTPEDAEEFMDTYRYYVQTQAGGSIMGVSDEPTRARWQLSNQHVYLSRIGTQVLVLRAPDGSTLDVMIGQFRGF